MAPPRQKKNVGPLQVRIANACNDSLEDIFDDKKDLVQFESGDVKATVSRCWAHDASDEDKEFLFGLTEKNMKDFYEKSNWGWNESQKRKELTKKTSQYLIARDPNGRIVAFVHYRFDMDFDLPVLYCYEIQLIEEVQRRGLGGHLMHILYKLAERFKMKKVILTVFKHNPQALNFYQQKLKFRLDATAPKENHIDYTILSKNVERVV
ncbi:N-alpha-acetyltransferase 40 [Galendromus occidentalis]|uniref:N-alpha-acetyltransferase 40 n=1 Tax=Galendromus occidentalis TaxID=34638 RepID=A0AAJ6QN81_9ACAR|nr:N-alpha-acetyltransferase 40 [Galendromus occidentalis]